LNGLSTSLDGNFKTAENLLKVRAVYNMQDFELNHNRKLKVVFLLQKAGRYKKSVFISICSI